MRECYFQLVECSIGNVEEEDIMIQGMLSVYDILVWVLFDMGTSHLFISSKLVDLLNIVISIDCKGISEYI